MAYLTRGFTLTLIIMFLFLVGVLYVSANQAYWTASPEIANQTRKQIEAERQTVTAQSIFINNLLVSIALAIPAIGLFPFLIVWHNTGQIIGLLSLAYGIPPSNYILNLTVLAFPELAAYTILASENIYVTSLAIVKGGAKERLLTQSWKSLLIYLTLLIIGAVTEMAMIGG